MNAPALVTYLRRQGVVLRAEDETLKVDAPADLLTPELREALAREKPAILKLLARTRKAAQAAWEAAMSAMAVTWDAYTARCQAAGREPAWLDDDALTQQIGAAIRAGDLPGTRVAITAWQAAWNAVIGPDSVLEPVPAHADAPPGPPPGLLAEARRLPAAEAGRIGFSDSPNPSPKPRKR